MAHELDTINWHQPWLAPLVVKGQIVAQEVRGGAAIHSAINATQDASVKFAPQSALPDGQAYEQFIFDTQTVPTRDNLHDFFNGLCWLTFPQIKKKLNQLQAAQIALDGVQPTRGSVRDALTLFDENAAFLVAPQPQIGRAHV